MRAAYLPTMAAAALIFALGAAAGEIVVVKVVDVAFSPPAVKARVGDTIEWVNDDMFDHTVTADDESFDLALDVGQSQRMDITRPGTIRYFCRLHPNMRGTIDVE